METKFPKTVQSAAAEYGDTYIKATCNFSRTIVHQDIKTSHAIVTPVNEEVTFYTHRSPHKTGVLLVGLAGNNGSTFVAGLLANKSNIHWETKQGHVAPNWYGSFLLSSTVNLGIDAISKKPVYIPLTSLVPFVDPSTLVVAGWDINNVKLGDAMSRAQVIELDLQKKLYYEMQDIEPWPGIYIPGFIASNQEQRANHTLKGSLYEQMEEIQKNIRKFRDEHQLTKIIVVWTATTERCIEVHSGVHDHASNLIEAIKTGHKDISPSILYAVAAIREQCCFINGSPQNTCVPAIIDLAKKYDVHIAGDDFKSGQTKLKSLLVEFLLSAGIKPISIASYNHLGNNDGKNLSDAQQAHAKEVSKRAVIEDMISSNPVLYPTKDDKPDHCVVIKYLPNIGDSKRALDEYVSKIFLNGQSTIVIHNTCEDSLLAVPIILDLVLLMELFERVHVQISGKKEKEKFLSVLSLLAFFLKAPLVPSKAPVHNGFNAQKSCIINILFALLGLPPETHMELEFKIPSLIEKL